MYELAKRVLAYIEIILKSIKYFKSNVTDTSKPQKMGNQILILGNGQSIDILKKNKEAFENYDMLVVNFYPLKAEAFWEYKPKYLALLDPVFFTDAKKSHPKYNDIMQLFAQLERVDWDLYVVTRAEYVLPIENKNIHYVKFSKVESFSADSPLGYRLFKRNKLAVPSENVSLAALNFALIFGYKKIALLGVELSYLQKLSVDEKNDLYMENEHFYGKEYIKKNISYERDVHAMLRTLTGFRVIANLAKLMEADIVNYSKNSYVQNYRKESIDS